MARRCLLLCAAVAASVQAGDDPRLFDTRIELAVSILVAQPGGELQTFEDLESRFFPVEELAPERYETFAHLPSLHGMVKLADGGELVYGLAYARKKGGKIHLELKRTQVRGDARTELPIAQADIEVTGSALLTLMDDDGDGRRLSMRIAPLLLADVQPELIDAEAFNLWVEDAALLELMPVGEKDVVINSSIYIHNNKGIEHGIPGTGVLRMSPRPFQGSAPCGSVRGHVLECEVGGHHYKLWSATRLLPEDPRHPGVGWKLYGSLTPLPEGQKEQLYYGWSLP